MSQNSENSKRIMQKTKMNEMNQFIQIVNPLTQTHLWLFQIWLEMKTKVQNWTKMSICHRTVNH